MKARQAKPAKRPQKRAKPLRATAASSVSGPTRSRSGPEDIELVQVTIRLRASLRDLVHAEARARRTTMQSLILLGLRELGLPVTQGDLQDRRKSGTRKDQPAAKSKDHRGRRHNAEQQAGNSHDRRQTLPPHSTELSQVHELLLKLLGQQTETVAGSPNIVVISTGCRCA